MNLWTYLTGGKEKEKPIPKQPFGKTIKTQLKYSKANLPEYTPPQYMFGSSCEPFVRFSPKEEN